MLDECAGGAQPCLSINDAMLLKAMPPNSRLCQGKRRPRPGSFSRHRVPTPTNRAHCLPLVPKEAESREPSEDRGSDKNNFSEEEFLRLQGIVLELQQLCTLQQKDLDSMRRPSQVPKTHAEVQTEACTGPTKCAASASFEQELDALHREVGEKSRELRKAQDTVRLLRSELQQQQQVSEQYQSQVEMLEEQLRMTTMQSRQQASSPKISLGLSRTSSARLTRAWQDSPRKRNGSLLESDLPSMCGHQATREGHAERTCHESSDDSSSEDDCSSAEIRT